MDTDGTISVNTEVLLEEWVPTTATETEVFEHTHAGYSENDVVTYRFEVLDEAGVVHSPVVGFAVRPYPVADRPVPVYFQADEDQATDIVLVPDEDITDMDNFRDHCFLMVRDGLFSDPHVNLARRAFNIYINPIRERPATTLPASRTKSRPTSKRSCLSRTTSS